MKLPSLSLLTKYYSLTSYITHRLPKYSLLHRLLLYYHNYQCFLLIHSLFPVVIHGSVKNYLFFIVLNPLKP